MVDEIKISGASENNLKDVSLTIPKGKLVVFAGVSGSGKSSLAFGTIAVESARQWQNNYSLYIRNDPLSLAQVVYNAIDTGRIAGLKTNAAKGIAAENAEPHHGWHR